MNTIFQIAVIVIAGYVAIEIATAIYIYRNRRTLVPRIRSLLRSILGLDVDRVAVDSALDVLHRKVNYIGRHTQFERQQLRQMGILKDDNVLPLRRQQ